MLEILEIVIKSAAFSILLLLCWNDAYRAGRNDERDERDEQIQRRQACADHTIAMDHTHGGDDDV